MPKKKTQSPDLTVQNAFQSVITVKNLMSFLQSNGSLTEKFIAQIQPMLQGYAVERDHEIILAGEVCETAYWIDSGCAVFFKRELNDEGIMEEEVVDFCCAGEILVIGDCFFGGLPSMYFVKILKGSRIVPFTTINFITLLSHAPEAESLAKNIMALEKQKTQRKTEILRAKPAERHKAFLKVFGEEILQYVSAKDIASFLGLSESALSRFKSKLHL